jgi:hypothetical protein
MPMSLLEILIQPVKSNNAIKIYQITKPSGCVNMKLESIFEVKTSLGAPLTLLFQGQ